MFGRKIKNEFTADGVTFPKDTNVLVSAFLLGRSEKYFKNAEIFDPERFDVKPPNYEKIHPFSYVPFSAGMLPIFI
jgi:cytochrome P450